MFSLKKPVFGALALVAGSLVAGAAHAGVSWSFNVHVPAPVYAQPQYGYEVAPSYYGPPVTYYRPAPVYYRPAPVYYGPPVVVVRGGEGRHRGHGPHFHGPHRGHPGHHHPGHHPGGRHGR